MLVKQKLIIVLEFLCSWRCRWIVITITAIALVIFNASIPTCEPCTGTSYPVYTDDPIGLLDLRLGRWDANRSFKMYDNAAVGEMYADLSSSRKVALATQSSIERLHEILHITAHWSGPISVAVFVAGNELTVVRGFVTWLIRCEPNVYRRLAIHITAPMERPALLSPRMPHWAWDCTSQPSVMERLLSKWIIRHPYPQNVMRNLARKNCHTSFVFLVDIDIVPSKGMAEELDRFLSKTPHCPLCAYVIPTYELDSRVGSFPANKSELLRLSAEQLAIPFHARVFINNQNASNFTKWALIEDDESGETHVSHTVTNFEMFYEPFYVAPDDTPPHDERFLGYGFTRNSQVYEMFLKGYTFQVLSPIFTIHWGLQLKKDALKEKQNKNNIKHFETFKYELFARYRKDPLNVIEIKTPMKTLASQDRAISAVGLNLALILLLFVL